MPDLFTDRTYKLNEEEQKAFDKMWDRRLDRSPGRCARSFPRSSIALGNGPLPTKEEFYRHHFPAELFDSGGNESGSYNRPPEAQPPDWIANNASLWMDRQMLDAYGYKDKPITQCHEICYPNTNPGNLSLTTQADYFIRHAMHSLAWGIPQIRMGIICDVGGSYYYGNWGGSGFCNCFPELNVKPSFVALATMTRVFDGAKFRKVVDLGSAEPVRGRLRPAGRPAGAGPVDDPRPSAGALEVQSAGRRRDVPTGRRPGQRDAAARQGWRGRSHAQPHARLSDHAGDELAGAEAGAPRYDEKPAGKATVLSDLASLDDWTLEKGHDTLLEYYNFLEPRRLGDFAFQPVAEFEGRKNVLQVTPRPIERTSRKDTPCPCTPCWRTRRAFPSPARRPRSASGSTAIPVGAA